MKKCFYLSAVALLAMTTGISQATVYNVGPGQSYTNVGDVPWENLAAGDTVNIYYRSTPYYEKFGIFTVGTASNPITVHGVPDGSGNLPIIDGNNATTRLELSYWGDERSLIKLGGSNLHPDSGYPSYIVIENLELRNARTGYNYTCDEGTSKTFSVNATSIWPEGGDHFTIRNCIIHECGNGFLSSGSSTAITMEGCYLYNNSYTSSTSEHSIYTECLGILFQYNWLAPPYGGNNLKDRSAGTIVRYNWIEDGSRQLDLVESYDYSRIYNDSTYGKDFVYGNILYEKTAFINSQIVHYGGDMNPTTTYRPGPLNLYNNTIVSLRTDTTYVVRPQDDELVYVYNNIAHAPNGSLTVRSTSGTVYTSHNWYTSGYALGGAISDSTDISGTAPGFVNLSQEDFHLTSGSSCIDYGQSLRSECVPDHAVALQYVKHQSYETRPSDSTLDLGAYEYSSGPADLEITTTSLPGGSVGVGYSQTLQATGGVTPYSWSVISGSLPAGLSLGSSTGTISGTPTASGTSNFTVRVTDSQSTPDTDDQALSIAVSSGPADLVITTTSLPGGTVGTAYSQTVQATGGVTPYSWSVISGSLPAGLSLGSSTGTISGTPTTSGTSNFTVRVTDSQSTPDTDDQALSITIAAAPSGPTYEFAAVDTESSNSTTSYVNKVSLVFTPASADEWIILGFAEFRQASTSYSGKVRLTLDGVTESEVTMEPISNVQFFTFDTVKAVSLSAASHTVNIDFASTNSKGNTYIRRARIIALRKAALVTASSAADSSAALTTTLTDYVTLNFTPASAGNYLLLLSAEINGATTSYSTQVQARLNGSTLDESIVESRDTTDWWPFMSFAVANCDTSQQTVTIAGAKETGSSAAHSIRRARVVAIRLTDGRFSGYQSAADDTESTVQSTTYVEKLSKSWSVSTAADWMVLSSFRPANSSTSYQTYAQVQLDDTTVLSETLRRPQDTTDWMNGGCMDLRELAVGTRRLDVDYKGSSLVPIAKIKYVHLVAVPLE